MQARDAVFETNVALVQLALLDCLTFFNMGVQLGPGIVGRWGNGQWVQVGTTCRFDCGVNVAEGHYETGWGALLSAADDERVRQYFGRLPVAGTPSILTQPYYCILDGSQLLANKVNPGIARAAVAPGPGQPPVAPTVLNFHYYAR